jgi:hypothetical protein
MKHLKKISLFLITATLLVSCGKDNDFYEEQLSNNQISGKDLLSSRTALDADSFGHQLDAASGATIQGYNFSPSTYEYEYNGDYFNLYNYFDNNYVSIKALDYNTMDELVYFIGQPESSGIRNLYTLNKDTEEVLEVGFLSGQDSDFRDKSAKSNISIPEPIYLGNAHELTFDGDGNLYVAFNSGKIMKYNLATNEMEKFVDLYDYEFYDGPSAVGFTYDFDNDRLLYSSESYDQEYIEGVWNYYYDSEVLAINPTTADVTELATLRNPDYYDNYYYSDSYYYSVAKTMEYIGNNKLAFTQWYGNSELVIADVTTGEYLNVDENYLWAQDLMYTYNDDVDDDGVLNEDDPFPASNMDEILSIGEYEFDIENQFSDKGTTMMDQVDALIAEINAQYDGTNADDLHRDFMRELSKITYYWTKKRLISRRERSQIINAADDMNIPFYNEIT